MIPTNTSRSKRDHSAGYETWIIHHGSCLTGATLFENVGIYKPFSRTPRRVRCSGNSFLSGDTTKNNNCPRVHCNIGFGWLQKWCYKTSHHCWNDLRNATRASINLTETFQQCCHEAEECVLPKHFYNVSCREHIIASCAKNGSQINFTTFALSQI